MAGVMTVKPIKEGDRLLCATCGHARKITSAWVEEMCKRYFHRHYEFVLYHSDLTRFKCSVCGNKTIRHVGNTDASTDGTGNRRGSYWGLSVEELRDIWQRESHEETAELESDERALIREILRDKLGIKAAEGHSAKACPQCGMVGNTCTCGRSWF
jgi:predicted RNA-binding Zn-ribbon protein involved in translation (DUF1610 family)